MYHLLPIANQEKQKQTTHTHERRDKEQQRNDRTNNEYKRGERDTTKLQRSGDAHDHPLGAKLGPSAGRSSIDRRVLFSHNPSAPEFGTWAVAKIGFFLLPREVSRMRMAFYTYDFGFSSSTRDELSLRKPKRLKCFVNSRFFRCRGLRFRG